jgi:hypothetical protein
MTQRKTTEENFKDPSTNLFLQTWLIFYKSALIWNWYKHMII